MATVKKGDDVTWKYGKGKAEGTVTEVHKDDVAQKNAGINNETERIARRTRSGNKTG